MPLAILFWVLMIVWLVFGWWENFAPNRPRWPGHLLIFVLLTILGWAQFGGPVK
jgi:FtsH-binding integral membrane protein